MARTIELQRESVRMQHRAKHLRVAEYKASKGCADCGERDVVVLELDHRDPDQKDVRLKRRSTRNPSSDWGRVPWDQLEAELEKCDVVCANCHRRRTARANGRWPVTGTLVLAEGGN